MGRSIVGRTDIIKSLRGKKPKSKATGDYRERNERLPTVGYASYVEYLKSPEWAEIKRKVLKKHPGCCCRGCPRPASQVHHWDYHDLVLLGLNNEFLLPICDQCHESAEFDGQRKRTLEEVQHHLRPLLHGNFGTRLKAGYGRRKTMLAQAGRKPKSKRPKGVTPVPKKKREKQPSPFVRPANPLGHLLPDCLTTKKPK